MTLFGPVFYYDLIRQSRRSGAMLVRLLYLVALFLMLWLAERSWGRYHEGTMPAGELARFVETFFSVFLAVQFFLVVLLTPAWTAGALTEEKEGQTLPFLLASNLHNHEIVLGKLASRLCGVTLIVLAGLPVFSLLQLLGGVDPGWLIAGFAGTGITMLSLASVSILWSTLMNRSRDAVLLAYLTGPAYVMVARTSLLLASGNMASFPSTDDWQSPLTFADVLMGFNAGDPFRAFEGARASLSGGAELGEVLRGYCLFHGVVTVVSLTLAILNVRRMALKEAGFVRNDKQDQVRKPVGDHPVLWRELHAERGGRFHWSGRLVIAALVLMSFLPPILMFFADPGRSLREYEWNLYVRIVGTLVACLLLLAVAVRAAGGITGERQKQTLDVLLTTPLELEAILTGKWYGSVLSIRWGWLWLGSILMFGVITGGLSLLALPLIALCWIVYANFLATLGLMYSVRFSSTLRATMATLLTTLGLWFGPGLLLACCGVLGSLGMGAEGLLKFLAGLCPPVALGMMGFGTDEFSGRGHVGEMIAYVLVGLFFWGIAITICWPSTLESFHSATARWRDKERQ